MMLKLIYAMLALAVLIALLGIANTLALSIYERKRELGLLRAVGMSRGAGALVRAVGVGDHRPVRYGARRSASACSSAGRWSGRCRIEGVEQPHHPGQRVAVVALGGAFAGVAAAILPARRAARLDVLKAVATG